MKSKRIIIFFFAVSLILFLFLSTNVNSLPATGEKGPMTYEKCKNNQGWNVKCGNDFGA